MTDITPTPAEPLNFDAAAIYDRAVEEGHVDPLASVIGEAMGAVSACWEHLDRAGIFQSVDAGQVAESVIEFLRGRPELCLNCGQPDTHETPS